MTLVGDVDLSRRIERAETVFITAGAEAAQRRATLVR